MVTVLNGDKTTSHFLDREGVQFLSDELSEVNDNLKLTVQFLIADFAAVSELSGKKYPLSSKNKRFVCVCAYTMAARNLVFNGEKNENNVLESCYIVANGCHRQCQTVIVFDLKKEFLSVIVGKFHGQKRQQLIVCHHALT